MNASETNTPGMGRRVSRAAHAALGRKSLQVNFEHGHWWVTHLPSGAQWSVHDARGPGSVEGFAFEQVTMGDDE